MNPKFFASVAIASLIASAGAQNLSQSESDALTEFALALQSDTVFWNSSLPLCDQVGVTCTQDQNGQTTVTAINLPDSQLSGTIPESISNLGNLATFNLRNNFITGTIPAQVADIASLTTLDLSSNQFYGTIPADFRYLQQLQSLDLSNNHLAGSFPQDFPVQQYQKLRLLGTNLLCPYPNYSSVPDNDYQDASSCQICNDNSCLNGGQCLADPSQTYTCMCPENVSGTYCQTTTAAPPPGEQPPTEQPTEQATQQPTEQSTDLPTSESTQQPTDESQSGQGTSGAAGLMAGALPLLFAALAAVYSFY